MLRTVVDLRAWLRDERRARSARTRTVGLVPTMGALHAGHLSLVAKARAQCDVVVLSLFVNPSQFDEPADLARYPRQERHDLALASAAGVDAVFAPGAAEVYPPGFSTTIDVGALGERLEGAVRGAGHFRAVATVVLKLLNMTAPDIAYFGQKDAQQALIVQRMVRDLDVPVRIEICPTVREPDGLAMSSRNARLSERERERALALSRGLAAAAALAARGERAPMRLTGAVEALLAEHAIVAEYVELVDAETLAPVVALERRALLLVAARLGETRLIDNVVVEPAAAPVERARPTLDRAALPGPASAARPGPAPAVGPTRAASVRERQRRSPRPARALSAKRVASARRASTRDPLRTTTMKGS